MVKFQPKMMASLDGLTEGVAKTVGVSDDHDAVAEATGAAHVIVSSPSGPRLTL